MGGSHFAKLLLEREAFPSSYNDRSSRAVAPRDLRIAERGKSNTMTTQGGASGGGQSGSSELSGWDGMNASDKAASIIALIAANDAKRG